MHVATYSQDYMGLPQELLLASERSQPHCSFCVDVTVIDDTILEGKESFTVTLSTDITGVRIARAPCIVEIVDNDSKRES